MLANVSRNVKYDSQNATLINVQCSTMDIVVTIQISSQIFFLDLEYSLQFGFHINFKSKFRLDFCILTVIFLLYKHQVKMLTRFSYDGSMCGQMLRNVTQKCHKCHIASHVPNTQC